jgi:hypothetical protein
MGSRKQDYHDLLAQYKGNIPVLHTLFKIVEDFTKTKLGLSSRIQFIKEVNDFVNKNRTPTDMIDLGIRSVMRAKQLNHKIFIASILKNTEEDDISKDVSSNPIVAELIQRKIEEERKLSLDKSK